MKTLGFGVAVSLLALMAATGAQAADPIMPDNMAIDMATSSWDGAYAGIGVVAETSTTIAETLIGLQGSVGYNMTMDSLLVGGEIYVMGLNSSNTGLTGSIGGEVRAGFLASDAILLYGAAGAEVTAAGNTYGTLGGGVEFAVADKTTLDLEYKYYMGLNNGWQGHHVGLSINWHF